MVVPYTDSNMVGNIDSRKYLSGYLIAFVGEAISWQVAKVCGVIQFRGRVHCYYRRLQ